MISSYSYKNHHTNNKKHGRCRGYELPTKPPKIVRDGRNFCGHPDCLDPITGDLRLDAEGWPDTMAIYRHFQVCTTLCSSGPRGRLKGLRV